MAGTSIEHFLHDARALFLQQGLIYKLIALLLIFAGIGVLQHILRLYITKVRSSNAAAEEQKRIVEELKRKHRIGRAP
jgi:hypothetical protein